MIRLVSWNINQQAAAWRELVGSAAFDVALLQETTPPPDDVRDVEVDTPPPWSTGGAGLKRPWRAAVARLSDRVTMAPILAKPVDEAPPGKLAVSRSGALAAAEITAQDTGETITAVSMYSAWERPLESTRSNWIYADASVHRLISDLSMLIGQQRSHRIIAAGDLNIVRGYGEYGNKYWRARYTTVFDRFEAIGMPCVGPFLPDGGHPPIVRPDELPEDSTTVPTFRTRKADPESATRQLDFVFASRDLVPRIRTRALNGPDEWGPSDHCQVMIELEA